MAAPRSSGSYWAGGGPSHGCGDGEQHPVAVVDGVLSLVPPVRSGRQAVAMRARMICSRRTASSASVNCCRVGWTAPKWGAVVDGQGAPLEDRGECGDRRAEEPSQTPMNVREGQGQSRECFTEAGQPVDLRQGLLGQGGSDGGEQACGGLLGDGAVTGGRDPGSVVDPALGVSYQVLDGRPNPRARSQLAGQCAAAPNSACCVRSVKSRSLVGGHPTR